MRSNPASAFCRPSLRQRGQAMIETMIVSAMVLLPLFLAIPVLAKYLDMRSHVVQAARYAAWERTVYFGGDAASAIGWFGFTNAWQANEKTDAQIKAEIAARLLSRSNASTSFTTGDKSSSSFLGGGQKALWQDHRGTSMLSYSQLQTEAAQACDPSSDMEGALLGYDCAPGTINRVLLPIASLAATLGPFTLEMGGKYTSTVRLSPQWFRNDSFLIDNTLARKTMTETAVVLGNGWTANGPEDEDATSVTQQVKGLTPLSLFNQEFAGVNIKDIVQTVFSIWAPELSTRKLELGKIEPDELPEDRLSDP